MGDWCGARSRRHGNENRDASAMAKRGWSVPSGTQREKCQKLWTGEVWPLDGSLLMGDFSVVLFRPHCMLASEEHPMKAHKNQRLLTLPTGSPTAVTHRRLPQNVACGFLALRSSDDDSQHGVLLQPCIG